MHIAVQVLYQIALGPLLSATLSFVNDPIRTHKTRFLRLVHIVAVVALAPEKHGDLNMDSHDTGAALLRASYVLFPSLPPEFPGG